MKHCIVGVRTALDWMECLSDGQVYIYLLLYRNTEALVTIE